jgi:hypothetical protein
MSEGLTSTPRMLRGGTEQAGTGGQRHAAIVVMGPARLSNGDGFDISSRGAGSTLNDGQAASPIWPAERRLSDAVDASRESRFAAGVSRRDGDPTRCRDGTDGKGAERWWTGPLVNSPVRFT